MNEQRKDTSAASGRLGRGNGYLLALIVLFAASCVTFKTATLYDGDQPKYIAPVPSEIQLAVEPVIFYDDTRDMWGLQKDECQEASITEEVVHSGERAIKLEWDRNAPGCTWAGIGIGWDGYAGKDLSSIFEHAAIAFYARSFQGRMFSLPFVLTLEDYSGGMGFCYTSNKYFERTAIDEVWQRVIIPLSDFDLETENLDPTNIKQLQIELQQNGAVYIDQIELIFFTPEPTQPWITEEERPNPTALPITLFDEAFIDDNGWGMLSDNCQDIQIKAVNGAAKGKAISAQWDVTEECHLVEFGVSWNRWFPVDLRPILNSGAISFKLQYPSKSPLGLITLGFEDYDRAKSRLVVNESHIQGAVTSGQWVDVVIPLSELQEGNNPSKIKHLYLGFSGEGEALIDDIRLIALP